MGPKESHYKNQLQTSLRRISTNSGTDMWVCCGAAGYLFMNVLVAIVWPNGLSMLHGWCVGSRGILLVWIVWNCDKDVVG